MSILLAFVRLDDSRRALPPRSDQSRRSCARLVEVTMLRRLRIALSVAFASVWCVRSGKHTTNRFRGILIMIDLWLRPLEHGASRKQAKKAHSIAVSFFNVRSNVAMGTFFIREVLWVIWRDMTVAASVLCVGIGPHTSCSD